jgi:hypothetical protein
MRKFILAVVVGLMGVSGAGFAGVVGGPVSSTTRVKARGTDVFNETFRGGERAVVSVAGDGDTDIDVFVYDEFGNLVASDTGATDRCYVSWFPSRTGRYTIRVVNLGNVWNEYTIRTN